MAPDEKKKKKKKSQDFPIKIPEIYIVFGYGENPSIAGLIIGLGKLGFWVNTRAEFLLLRSQWIL